ncbi:MAG TPA: outer membrane lipoprotein carrier protein LolA [Xanthobacteraceae bacterium]|jgi:outer membrane lipoprotein-sorting protein
MAGGCQAMLVAALLGLCGGLLGAGDSAWAQTVPLPQPAPFPKSTDVPRPPSAVTATRPPTSASPAAPTPPAAGASPPAPAQTGIAALLPSIFGGNRDALDPKQRALVDKASAYLSSVQVMSGRFAQIAPDGSQSSGQFYVQKPGRLRFDYDPPAYLDIISDGASVVVRDRRLGTQDAYALSQTPLRFLLSDHIDLVRDANVTNVYADKDYVTVVVEERQLLIGTSRLMMMFGAKDFALKQWVVTDPQGYDTTIAISNLDTTRRPDPSLFRIEYAR